MQKVISEYISSIEVGDPIQFKNMIMVPLIRNNDAGVEYLTLRQAQDKQLLKATEVDEDGSVDELLVINNAEMPVLLLDGEELMGAKQNRVINSTILLKEKSRTVVSVSCSEQGRWSSESDEFRDSDVVMSPNIRSAKTSSVSMNLETNNQFQSDQDEIWNEIDELSNDSDVESETGAMKDVYSSKEDQLNEYLKAFPPQPNQYGLLVLTNGKVVGFDILSQSSIYSLLSAKLVKSYAIDALRKKINMDEVNAKDKVVRFLNKAICSEMKSYESVGYGSDYRLINMTMVGSSLVVEDVPLHMAFFRSHNSEHIEPMSDIDQRRRFRM